MSQLTQYVYVQGSRLAHATANPNSKVHFLCESMGHSMRVLMILNC